MQSFLDLGINVNHNKNQQKIRCPNCIKLGKQNYKDTCLSVNSTQGLFYCHKCGWKGKIKDNIKNFNKFPLKVRQNLVSSWFRGSLSGSPDTLDLINAGKYKEAA